MKLKWVLWLCVFGVIIAGCSKGNESVLLRLKFAKGDELAFAIKVNARCSEKTNMALALEATFTVDSVVNNNTQYDISTKLDAIKTDINIGGIFPDGFSEHYDSKKDFGQMSDEEREIHKRYDTVVTPYYDIAFNKLGEIVKPFTVNKKLINPPFAAGLVQLPFPERRLKAGDMWTAEIYNPLFHPLGQTRFLAHAFKLTYKIEDITPDKVYIDVQLTMEMDGGIDGGPKIMQGGGQYVINRANGQVINGRIDIPQANCGNAVLTILKREATY